jgi:MFS transporter, ACS family, glucarate transporter
MQRYTLIFLLFLLSMILYIDRVCIAAAKGPIASDLGLSDQAMGLVFSAFALGYAAGQIPTGYLADRYGPRIILVILVSLWSVLTAMTGLAQGLISLVIIRFLFGVGEAGAFPASARAFFNWLPVSQRGRANGITFSGARIGAALSFPLLTWMLARWEWRLSFVILGAVGIIWAAFWFLWFRDYPYDRKVVDEEINRENGMSFGQVLRSRSMVLAMAQYFASKFTFFITLTWMFSYLKETYRLSDSETAGYAMVPLLGGACAQWVAGFMVDLVYRSNFSEWSRRLPAILGFLLAVVGMSLVSIMDSPKMAVACFTLATFGAEMTISPSWAYCIDLGGKNSGAISASMNMFGNIGAFVSANAFPYLHRLTGDARSFFAVAVFLNVIAIFCWFLMRPGREKASAQRLIEQTS